MTTHDLSHSAGHSGQPEQHHPGAKTYVMVGLILLVITIVEVAALYMQFLGPLFVPFLLLLMAGKFVLVVGYYMHLKFDHRLLTYFFGWGILIAALILIAVVWLENYDLTNTARQVLGL
mgnify:CR=1 FL=1